MELDGAAPCWIWPGETYTDTGYGRVQLEEGRTQSAHRFVYERLIGPIPAGLQLHHECQQRACVNPAHLRPVTTREHGVLHRKSHCKYGHPLNGVNLYIDFEGKRRCSICRRKSGANRYAKKKTKAKAKAKAKVTTPGP